MTDVSVDYGIPMPPRWASLHKHPWLTLKLGGSFVWPNSYKTAWVAVKKRRRRHGELYRVAKVTEDGKHLIRVWRVG